MKQFNYEIDPFQNIGSKNKEAILKILDQKINFHKPTFFERFIFSTLFRVISNILCVFYIGIGLLNYRRKLWKKWIEINTKKLIADDIYKLVFEAEYSNVKVSKATAFSLDIIHENRGPKIPKDAEILHHNFGPVFKVENIPLQTAWIMWRWVRDTDKGAIVTDYPKIYLYSNKLQPKFKKLELQMKNSNLFSKRGHDLENTEFNEKYWYDYNDGVKGRLFFPLSSQEQWVAVKNNKNLKHNQLKGFEINVKDGFYLFAKRPIFKSEYGLLKVEKACNSKSKFIKGIYKNLEKDIAEISGFLRLATINKYFFK